MATEERNDSAALSNLLRVVQSDARRFSFFRLIYLLDRLYGAPSPGQLGPPSAEKIRFRGDPSLAFSASDVSSALQLENVDGTPQTLVTTTFLSLYGSTSPLPPHYAEEIAISDYQGGPQPVREFLDVLHHRLHALLYRAWAKYRWAATYRQDGADPFTRRMFCLSGFDAFADRPASALPRFLYLRYAPLLAMKSRPAWALELVLRDLLPNMRVVVRQFCGSWTPLEGSLQNRLGVTHSTLGDDMTLGARVYEGSARVTLVFEGLRYDEYLELLPGGPKRPLIQQIVNVFSTGIHEVMLELHLNVDEAPRLQLGSSRSSTLGRTAWLAGKSNHDFAIEVGLADGG